MGKENDLTTVEKQKRAKLLSEELSALEMLKDLCRDHRTIKRAVENVTKNSKPMKRL